MRGEPISSTENEAPAAYIDILLLADHAEVINGKLYIMGGGWNRMSPAQLPVAHPVSIAISVVFPDPSKLHRADHRLELSVTSPSDEIVWRQRLVFERQGEARKEPEQALLGIDSIVPLPSPGQYSLRATVDDSAVKELAFDVEEPVSS